MTTIKVTCPSCGDIDIQPHEMELVVSSAGTSYSFRCQGCQMTVTKPADAEVADLLSSAGVTEIVIPAEACEQHTGANLTHDDLLDFALQLRDDRRIAASMVQLAQTMKPAPVKRKKKWNWVR